MYAISRLLACAQGVGLDGATLSAMFAPLRRAALPALTALLLRGNPIGDEGVAAVCLAVREARAMPNLRILDLSGSDGDSDRDVGWGAIAAAHAATAGGGGHKGATSMFAASRHTVACKNAPVEHVLNGHGKLAEPDDMLISDHGVRLLADTMRSGCLASLTRLYLHAQPRIGSIGFDWLQDALLDGACGKLLVIQLEGHDAGEAAWSALVRVLRARGINSDVLPDLEVSDPRMSMLTDGCAHGDIDDDEA